MELEDYRKHLVAHIAKRELMQRAYISWLAWFDDNCEDFYIKSPPLETVEEMRNRW